MKKLPYNLLPSYAPLGCDFLKPLDYRPTNAIQQDSFKKSLSNDGCHPNADTYYIMEELVLKAISEAVR